MSGGFLSWLLRFVFLLPFRVVYIVLSITRLRLFLSLLGFGVGTIAGLVCGYFYLFYPLPTQPEDVVVRDIGEEGKDITTEEKNRFFLSLPPWVSNPDIERIDWLNGLLRLMWPHVDKAVAAQVVAQVSPMIDQYKPKFIASIGFEALTLGTLPPTVIGIKSLETRDDEVIIQPMLRWHGNPNIHVVAKAYGLQASVQVMDLSVETVARITLKPLVPVFPCFAKITVSLMTPPKVDFALKLLGFDLMAIPVVPYMVQKTVNDVVSGMLLWPNYIEVYDETPAKPVGWLMVSGLKAVHLSGAGLLGKADVYVHLTLGHALGNVKTNVRHNTLNPEWDDAFKMRVSDPKHEVLGIEVYDKDKPRDRLMGRQRIKLKKLGERQRHSFTLPLLPKMDEKEMQKEKDKKEKKEKKEEKRKAKEAAEKAKQDLTKDVMGKDKDKVKDKEADEESDSSGSDSDDSSDSDDDSPRKRKDLGTISLDLEYVPFSEEEAALQNVLETNDMEEVVFRECVPVGGGVLRVIPHSGSGLEAKRHANPRLYMRFRNKKWKSAVYERSKQIDKFVDDPLEVELEAAPITEVLHVEVYSKNTSMLSINAGKERIGHCDIPLRDVVTNRRINEEFTLLDSHGGVLKIELQWHERKPDSATVK